MEDNKEREKEEEVMHRVINEAETEKYMKLLEQEVWDEAIRSYNDVLFGLLRYL